jgi:hypothetical protein
VFDKKKSRSFTSPLEPLAAERGYYDLTDSQTLDDAMTRSENTTAPIINGIREHRSVARLSERDRTYLTGFVVLQALRTRGSQEGMKHGTETMTATLRERTGLDFPEFNETPEEHRRNYLKTIPEFAGEFLPHFLSKDLMLLETDGTVPFCISDNPVTMFNSINKGDGLWSTIGFAVPGIEIYLPISSELTLAFMCPTLGLAHEVLQEQASSIGNLTDENAFYYLRARDTGKPLKRNAEHVKFLNSLQVFYSERLVISSQNDFTDAIEMVKKDPRLTIGPRGSVK